MTTLEEIAGRLGGRENLEQTRAILERLSFDEYLHRSTGAIGNALQSGQKFWSLAEALQCISQHTSPAAYLEIGVRKGRSMAMVATASPACRITAVDLWMNPYASVENPGPEFVLAEMRRLGHQGPIEFYNGSSHDVLPELWRSAPDALFDIVTVDGDHSDEGAWSDLAAVHPRVRPGGYLLFDDIVHPKHTLLPVWRRFESLYGGEYDFLVNERDRWGTAIAWKRPSAPRSVVTQTEAPA